MKTRQSPDTRGRSRQNVWGPHPIIRIYLEALLLCPPSLELLHTKRYIAVPKFCQLIPLSCFCLCRCDVVTICYLRRLLCYLFTITFCRPRLTFTAIIFRCLCIHRNGQHHWCKLLLLLCYLFVIY